MTAVLLLRAGDVIVGRCAEECYDARLKACTCVCAGENHRVGREQALVNARLMTAQWVSRARENGQAIDTFEVCVEAQHEPLFPLEAA